VRLTPTAEQQELRHTVRRFLSATSPEPEVRRLMATEPGWDPAVWRRLCAELELAGLAVPEAYGGAGFGFAELGVVAEEAGRALFCGPLLSSAVLATRTLLALDDAAVAARLLPALVAGERTATVVLPRPGSADALTAVRRGGGHAVSGEVSFVLDGHTAGLLLAAVPTGGDTALVAVDGDAPGVRRSPQPTFDLTRRLATVRFDDAPGVLLADGARAADAVRHGVWAARIAIAAGAAGGSAALLEMAVGYAKTRRQFGRPIGGFQAVKHLCADLFVTTETARAAAAYAVRVVDEDDPAELALAAALAKSCCCDAYVRAAGLALQVHGGIGFTWDHPLHLYLKRAKADQVLLGSSTVQRELLGDAIGI
jgi:alkylation response protein AidB-like acyl-CoA dehydrogenase